MTGGAGGIGLAVALQAAAESALVAICDVDADRVRAATVRIREYGGTAIGVVGDVTDREMVNSNVKEIVQALGPIDVLVNNAAVQRTVPVRELTEAHWRRELDVCLTGSFFWSQAVGVTCMIPRRSGSIVNVGSGASLAAMPNSVSYVTAKHGLVGLTKALAVDWAQYGIRVNCVCPGFTMTELAQSVAAANPEMMRQRVQRIPLGTPAEPEDPAAAVVFLASNDAKAISGSVLSVDGGTIALSSGYTAPRD